MSSAASALGTQLQQQLTRILGEAAQSPNPRAAADGYAGALRLLDAALAHRRHELTGTECSGLERYRQQLAAHVASLSPQPPPTQHADPMAAATAPKDDDDFAGLFDGADMDAALAEDATEPAAAAPAAKPRKKFVTNAPRPLPPPTRYVPPAPATSSSPPPAGGGGQASSSPPPPLKPAPSRPPPPSDTGGDGVPGGPPSIDFTGLTAPAMGAAPTGNRAKYGVRASDLVYRAVDVATELVKRGDLKRAVDMLQHALDESRDEENVPANLRTVADMCTQLRSKYLATNPPRRVQDNLMTEAESEVLRRAGTTSRILLPSWDDPSEGFARENVWYPGTGLYTDDFTPQLDPTQVEHGAVFDRLAPVDTSDPTPPSSPTPEEAQGDDDEKKTPQGEDKEGQDSKPPAEAQEDPVEAFDKLNEAEPPAVPPTTPSPPPHEQQQPKPAPKPVPQMHVVHGAIDPARIKQTVVGDCSFVCSLIVCAQLQRRFPSVRLITSSIYPQLADGTPVVSRNGKYVVKMLVNGTTRLVVVDDRLPMKPREAAFAELDDATKKRIPRQLLCSFSTDPNELWVSLLEKAFIKVCGGSYDWPGSVSSSDLYMLSGWLPEAVDLPGRKEVGGGTTMKGAGGDFDADYHWKRLASCHPRGAVAVTVNTPATLPDAVKQRLGLADGHAYAILDVKEVNGERLVKVKNPWSKAGAWKGLYSLGDARNWTPELLSTLGYTESEASAGVFWIPWRDLCAYFGTLHLSWNPYMLYPGPGGRATKPTRLAAHARFDYADSNLLLPQFQLRLSAEVPGTVSRRIHLVLARHVTDHREFRENLLRTGLLVDRPFLTVHVYDVTHAPSASAVAAGQSAARTNDDLNVCYGRRVADAELPKGCLVHRGIYRNIAFQTVSFNAGAASGYREYSVVVSQLVPAEVLAKGRPQPFTFSITAHSAMPPGPRGLMLRQIPYKTLRHATAVNGQWAKGSSCGGRVGGPTFAFNPHFAFTLKQPSRILATLVTPGAASVMLHVVRRNPNAPKQHATVVETPWEARADTISDALHTDAISGAASTYRQHNAVCDSTLSKCHVFTSFHDDDEGDATPPPPGPPPMDADFAPSPPPPSGPPPSAMSADRPSGALRLVMPPVGGAAAAQGGSGPQEQTVALGPRWPQLDKRSARNLFCLAAMSCGRFAAPKNTKLLFKGVAIDGTAPLDRALVAVTGEGGGPLDFWGGAAASGALPPVVVAPMTDDLDRTADLAKCEAALFAVARGVMELVASQSPDADVAGRKRAFAGGEERATQLLLQIDACAVPTEKAAACRKALVESVQLIQDVIDAVVEPTPGAAASPASGGGSASPVAPATAISAYSPSAASESLMASNGGVMPAGDYVVIPSAWRKGEPGVFRLAVEAEEQVDLQPVPAEGAGWFPLSLPTITWPSGAAVIACKGTCNLFVRAIFAHEGGGGGGGDSDAPVALKAELKEAGTGRVIVQTAFSVCCRLPAVRLDGGAKYRLEVRGDPKSAHRGSLVVRCFTSTQGGAVLEG